MDQGIIENFKRHYKKLLLCRRLEAMDDRGKEFNFTLLDALHVARYAWEQVSKSTIRNCFAKAKFIEEEIRTEPQDAELLEIWKALPAEEKMHENEEIELPDFLEADERIATSGSFTLEEIAEEMLYNEEPVESEVIVGGNRSVRGSPACLDHCPKVHEADKREARCDACDRLDNEMNEIRRKKMRQPTIFESFGLIG